MIDQKITVEAHDHEAPAPRDLTPWVQALRFSFDVSQQGGGASFTFRIPFAQLFNVLPREPGWWIVIRDEAKRALWWGRVSDVSTGRTTGGGGSPEAVVSIPVSVRAESFVSLVNNSQIVLAAAGAILPFDGAIYNFDLWSKNLNAWLSVFKFKKPGGLLALLWKQLARAVLPPSLGGGFIGDQIHVAWSLLDAPSTRADVLIEVPGVAINAVGSAITPRGSVWSMLSGAFSADPSVVELFPSLERAAIPETPISLALGGVHPVLNYRIKPLLVEPLATPGAAAAGVAGPPSVLSALAIDGVIDFTASWSDSARANGFFAQSAVRPGSQMAAFGLFGVPDFDYLDLANHGLRLFDLDWPFYPPDLEGAAKTALSTKIDGLIDLAKAIKGDGQRYAKGSITMRYSPDLRAGVWYMPDIGAAPQFWRCYATSVSHSVTVSPDGGIKSKRTTIQYEKGHLFP